MSVTLMAAVLAPVADGENVAVIVHEAPAATLTPQVVVWLKSELLAPVIEMLVRLNAAPPVFFRVTFVPLLVVPNCLIPNETNDRDRVTTGVAPVPVIETVWGLPVALSAMVTLADLAPSALGVKMTLMEQLAAAANVAPQVFI